MEWQCWKNKLAHQHMGLPKAAIGIMSCVYSCLKCAIFKNIPKEQESNDRKFVRILICVVTRKNAFHN